MPTKVIQWQCDICHETYEDSRSAEACEDQGAEECPPWLKVGAMVHLFTEDGVLDAMQVQRFHSGHDIQVVLVQNKGLELERFPRLERFPLRMIDPMRGADFARDIDREDSPDVFEDTARRWVGACRGYGIEPDLSRARWASTRRGRELADRIQQILAEDRPIYDVVVMRHLSGYPTELEVIPSDMLTTARMHYYGIHETADAARAHFDAGPATEAFLHSWVDDSGATRYSACWLRRREVSGA